MALFAKSTSITSEGKYATLDEVSSCDTQLPQPVGTLCAHRCSRPAMRRVSTHHRSTTHEPRSQRSAELRARASIQVCAERRRPTWWGAELLPLELRLQRAHPGTKREQLLAREGAAGGGEHHALLFLNVVRDVLL